MNTDKLFTPYEGDEKYIFISYKHDDWELVSKIIADLNSRGYRIWYDEGLHGGQNFVNEIAVRIIECEVFISFLSKNYITSDYCINELHYAFSKFKTVIPIMLDDVDLPPEVEFRTVKINRISLQKLGSEKALVDRLCDWDKEILDPCHRDYIDSASQKKNTGAANLTGQTASSSKKVPDPKAPSRPKWLIPAAGGAILILLAAVLFFSGIFGKQGNISPSATEPVSVITEAVVTGIPETRPAETSSTTIPKQETAASKADYLLSVPTLSPDALNTSGKKALSFLSERLNEGVPLSVYDPKGSNASESDYVYDNALAALAILSENSGSANLRNKNAKKILDQLTEQVADGSVLNNDSDLKGLSALVIALLRADKNEASLSYVKNAQTVLDWVIENRADKAGGYSEKRASNEKVTADNLWLYTAFTMLHEKTGNDRYLEAARSAETFVYSQRSEDGTYYLPGDGGKNLLSAEVQALAAVLLNDRTGIGKAAELVKEEGCYGPDNVTEGCSMEASALMALAYKNLGMEAEANAVLSALSRYQLNNGGIPEANAADMTDGFGRTYSNAVRTSVTSLFVLAMNGGLSSAASRND